MWEKMKNTDTKKLIGIAAIIMAAFLIIVFSLDVFGDSQEKTHKNEAMPADEQQQYEENQAKTNQTSIPEDEGIIGGKDIDSDSVHIDMILLPDMEKEIPDVEALQKAIEDYVIKKDLWENVTRAQTDFIIIKDYNKNTVQLEFELDDRKGTHIVALIHKSTGNISLNHY